MCREADYAHLDREHDLGLRIHQVRLVLGRRRHVEETGGELRCSVPAPALVVAEAVGLDDEGDSLQHFVKGLLHGALLLQLLDELEDDGGLLDRVDILERRGVLDVEGRAEGGGEGLGAQLLVEVLFGELRVVLQVLFHAALVCHGELESCTYPRTLLLTKASHGSALKSWMLEGGWGGGGGGGGCCAVAWAVRRVSGVRLRRRASSSAVPEASH